MVGLTGSPDKRSSSAQVQVDLLHVIRIETLHIAPEPIRLMECQILKAGQ